MGSSWYKKLPTAHCVSSNQCKLTFLFSRGRQTSCALLPCGLSSMRITQAFVRETILLNGCRIYWTIFILHVWPSITRRCYRPFSRNRAMTGSVQAAPRGRITSDIKRIHIGGLSNGKHIHRSENQMTFISWARLEQYPPRNRPQWQLTRRHISKPEAWTVPFENITI